MIIRIGDDFDLNKIAESGQCFRWTKQEPHTLSGLGAGNDTFRIIAGGSCLYITSLGDDRYELDCTDEEYRCFWQDYFDLRENYRSIRNRIDPKQDPFLWKAAEHEKGIRILRQDAWEMLVTFIISQNRNIPAIRRSVELLSEACGDKRTDSEGREYYASPTPAAAAALTQEELSACRLGYRCKYVHAAAEAVLHQKIELNYLQRADKEAAREALTGLYGVGVKVANCVSLFGLHHTDAFPIDVWMKRILKEQYPTGYPYEKYSPYNGIFQQYMFAYYRHSQAKSQ